MTEVRLSGQKDSFKRLNAPLNKTTGNKEYAK
jgi:hypothetical protein